jgi:tetratricopeptide (TPR) repeat protein
VLAAVVLAGCLVLTWRQVGYWRNSETLWRHALDVTGGNYIAHERLGMALAAKGRPADTAAAERHLRAALQFNPDQAETLGNLGLVLERLGRVDEAAVQMERMVKLDPKSPKGHLHLGRLRQLQGRPRDAVPHLVAAVQLEPTLSEARLALAAALADNGEFDRAREQLDFLLRQEPSEATLHDELGRLLLRQGKPTEAVASFDRALALLPSLHEAWNNKGLALETLGLFPAAAACFRRAVERDAEQPVYLVNLAHALYDSGNPGPAADHFAAAFRLHPDWPRPTLTEAWLQATHPDAQRRNGTQALRKATIVCQATEYKLPIALDVLAAAHAELGQFDQAVARAQAVLKLLPDGLEAAAVKAVKQRLSLYEQRRPYREAPAASTEPR